jgi:UDP-N-acetylglucosamine--N-acetylmuramyl-(pentapeptide) pyrophosphoryl-undecaprenol N-acetylglucosamine transferase
VARPTLPTAHRPSPRALLVASTGGHLAQLHALAPRIPGIDPGARTWVTFDTPQSRNLLSGEDVVFVDYTAPRDWRTVGRNLAPARRLLNERRFTHVFSTGSAIALTFLPLARAKGLHVTYVESAARSQGPSLTGRILARTPGVQLGTQYAAWANERWSYVGSVLDGYAAAERERTPAIRRVVVTLGTIPYGFRRLVERMVAILPEAADVLWQTGTTDVSDLPITGHAELPGAELDAAIRAADVVIAHSGTGSALAALEAGKCPLLVPREAAHAEHVDDHQRQIGEELARRGLARYRDVADLTAEDLRAAAGVEITRVHPPPLQLGTPPVPTRRFRRREPIGAPGSEPASEERPAGRFARARSGRFERRREPAGAPGSEPASEERPAGRFARARGGRFERQHEPAGAPQEREPGA